MGIWFKRGILCLWLVLLAAGLVVYFYAAAITESLLISNLEARGGKLDLEFIRLRPEGLILELNHYEDAVLTVNGLTIACAWSQLWGLRDGLGGRWHAEEVRVRLDASSETDGERVVRTPAARAEALAAQLDSWPVRAVALVVDDLWLEQAGQAYRLGVDLSFLRSPTGNAQLTGDVEAAGIDLNLRARVIAGGTGLALDFVGGASDWEAIRTTYLPALADLLGERQAELYLNPLGEGRGFLDLSGHVLWAESRADELELTLLADLGPAEFYFENGECVLRATSFGFASGGSGSVRAYARGAVASVRYGSWMQPEGDWALRVDGPQAAAEIRLGDALSLSLGHEDWQLALTGAGTARAYLEAGGVDAESVRNLPIADLPADLELDMDLSLEGWGTFKDYGVENATIEADTEIRGAVMNSKALTVRDLQATALATVSRGSLNLQTLDFQMGEVVAAGFSLGNVASTLARQEGGVFSVSSMQGDFMGGHLQVAPATINPADLENLSLDARVDSVELAQLASAVPQFKGQVSGTVSGHLVAGWRQGQMILTGGQLDVDPETEARLQYQVDGLLTGGMEPGTVAYERYQMAEKAFADLELERLRIEVFPGGNPTRPFRMELFGVSDQDGLIVPVDFDLNVNVGDTAGLLEILQLMQRGELLVD